MTAPPPRPKSASPLKTYSHLGAGRRLPTEYEVVSSKLHYYPRTGFAVNVPQAAWFERHQRASPLVCDDWEQFSDPRATTYTRYVTARRDAEAYVDGVLRSLESGTYDAGLDAGWRDVLQRAIVPLRFPWHGLQMVAAYVGQLAPSGRITITAAFQAADEVRRIQVLSYRTAQIARAIPGFGANAKDLWQDDPMWQPLRELVERLLVTYDWGEAFVALNLCVKPVLDELFLSYVPSFARSHRDYALGMLFFSLYEDALWQRAWSAELARTALEARPANKTVIEGWLGRWAPRVGRAIEPFTTLFEAADAKGKLVEFHRTYVGSLGLEVR